MNWRSQFSDEEIREMYADCCAAYQSGEINQREFFLQLAKLGYNATDIYEAEKFYRPAPPENDNETD